MERPTLATTSVDAVVSCCISPPFGGLSTTRGQIAYVLLTRAPLYRGRSPFSCDLHVLGAPLTFVLSQDQTLQFEPVRLANHPKTAYCHFSHRLPTDGYRWDSRDPRIFTQDRTQFSRTEGRACLPSGAVILIHQDSLSTDFYWKLCFCFRELAWSKLQLVGIRQFRDPGFQVFVTGSVPRRAPLWTGPSRRAKEMCRRMCDFGIPLKSRRKLTERIYRGLT
jgi:hypothetical protein